MKIKDQILNILRNSNGHMTADQMYLYCANNGIKTSVASVYRVLGKLAEEGCIRKVSIPGKSDIFDKTLLDHEHLICIHCGKVEDIDLKNMRKSIMNQIKEDIESYDLCIRYICPKCKKIKNKK